MLGGSTGTEFFHVVMLRAFDPIGEGPIELRALFSEQLDNDDDLILLCFVEITEPLGELVGAVDFSRHIQTIELTRYRVNSIG